MPQRLENSLGLAIGDGLSPYAMNRLRIRRRRNTVVGRNNGLGMIKS